MYSNPFAPPLTTFQKDVAAGLLAHPKRLSSKYFYGGSGDKLFARIMELPEYYLTRCEYDILLTNASEILQATNFESGPFEIVELGAGNGLKTRILLREALRQAREVTYVPLDISADCLRQLQTSLSGDLPTCPVRPYALDYTRDPLPASNQPRLWLYLGSNIGNYALAEAGLFLQRLSHQMGSRDKILIGFDLHKSPEIILPAYNDAQGVTAEFNLNLLRRINEECGGNFDPRRFVHAPRYDTKLQRAESYLRSVTRQWVVLADLGLEIEFEPGETIFTEISQKYTFETIAALLSEAGLTLQAVFTDTRQYYTNVLCAKS